MTQDFGLPEFSAAVDDAITRARRAAAEVREQNTKLRAALAPPQEEPVTPSGDDDEDFSQKQIMTSD
ncbi:hypothetical protein [Actinocrispum sp. NPDC049592]|uniref:hypothetical protein n=1 Tax=Actinocrispum sp. NPDC049592 TaxID=3154835 RepID=UPI00342EF480